MLHCSCLTLTKNANTNGAAERKVRSCKGIWLLAISKLPSCLCYKYQHFKTLVSWLYNIVTNRINVFTLYVLFSLMQPFLFKVGFIQNRKHIYNGITILDVFENPIFMWYSFYISPFRRIRSEWSRMECVELRIDATLHLSLYFICTCHKQ